MRKNLAALSILAAAAVLVTGGVASACVKSSKKDKPHRVVTSKKHDKPVVDEEVPVVVVPAPVDTPVVPETPAPTPAVETWGK